MYRTAMLPSYWVLRLAGAVVLDPAGLVRKLAQVQQFRGVQRNGVGVAQLVVGPLVLPVGHPLIGGAGAGGLQARRLRRVAQRQEHQGDRSASPAAASGSGPADQRVPADRAADRPATAPRRSCRCGWAGRGRRRCAGRPPAAAGDTVERAAHRRRRRRSRRRSVTGAGAAAGLRATGAGSGGGAGIPGATGAGPAADRRAPSSAGRYGIVMPGATSIVGWMTVSDGGGGAVGVGGGGGACGTPA